MPKKEFEFNAADLILLRRFYKKSPKLFGRSVVNTINTVAFESRLALLDTIQEQMTVRDNRFISRQMRVDKAKGVDIRTAEATVGSIAGPRFTGWVEQETGKKPENSRMMTLVARRGSIQNKAVPRARAKSSNDFARISDFQIKAKSRQHRLIIFLQMMSRKKKLFIMPRRYKRLQRGVYQASKRKLKRFQTFGDRKVQKEPWMKPTIQHQLKEKDMRKAWATNISRVLPRRLR